MNESELASYELCPHSRKFRFRFEASKLGMMEFSDSLLAG
jgi:hypothetical protein